MRLLFLLFIIVPIVEMLILFEVSDYIGALNTVALVVLTAAVGIQVLKSQGLSTFRRANSRLDSGQLPALEMLEGLFLAVGGAFLLTPGFITDTLGFLCLIGPTRRMLVRALIKSGRFSFYTSGGDFQGFTFTGNSERGRGDDEENNVYEGEYSRETRRRRPTLKDRDK